MSHDLLSMILPPFEVDPNTNDFVIDPLSGEYVPYEPEDPGLDVSGPVVRHTDKTRACCFTNGYLRIQHDLGRCNGIEMISS